MRSSKPSWSYYSSQLEREESFLDRIIANATGPNIDDISITTDKLRSESSISGIDDAPTGSVNPTSIDVMPKGVEVSNVSIHPQYTVPAATSEPNEEAPEECPPIRPKKNILEDFASKIPRIELRHKLLIVLILVLTVALVTIIALELQGTFDRHKNNLSSSTFHEQNGKSEDSFSKQPIPSPGPSSSSELNNSKPFVFTKKPIIKQSMYPLTVRPTKLTSTLGNTNHPSSGHFLSPTEAPTHSPSRLPTGHPTKIITQVPTSLPSADPSARVTKLPTARPTIAPTNKPKTKRPTESPTESPTITPTDDPSRKPTVVPTITPTFSLSESHTEPPNIKITDDPTEANTDFSTVKLTGAPTSQFTEKSTKWFTNKPTKRLTDTPTKSASITAITDAPARRPFDLPTHEPSYDPKKVATVTISTLPPTSSSIQPTESSSIRTIGTMTVGTTSSPTFHQNISKPEVNHTRPLTNVPSVKGTNGATIDYSTFLTQEPTFITAMEPSSIFTPMPTKIKTLVPTVVKFSLEPTPEATIASTSSAPMLKSKKLDAAELLLFLQNFTTSSLLNDFSTPQGLAFQWLAQQDQMSLELADSLQRYALLTVDYAANMSSVNLHSTFADPGLHECDWKGISCNGKVVTSINWARKGLSGYISPELHLLDSLENLDLAENKLRGTLDEIWGVHTLKTLYLHQNHFMGSISNEVGSMINLENLYLGHNRLTGSLPTQIGGIGSPMRYLILHHNIFSGRIPNGLRLRQLHYLDLGYNSFSGPLPTDWMSNMIRLRHLFIDHNRFTGSLPAEFSMIGNGRLKQFHVNDNLLTGRLPTQWGVVWTLTNMNIQHNLFTEELDNSVCDMSVFVLGELVELRADCGVCKCEKLCDTCSFF